MHVLITLEMTLLYKYKSLKNNMSCLFLLGQSDLYSWHDQWWLNRRKRRTITIISCLLTMTCVVFRYVNLPPSCERIISNPSQSPCFAASKMRQPKSIREFWGLILSLRLLFFEDIVWHLSCTYQCQ